MSEAAESPAKRPALRIVRGEPTPEEVAALVAVLRTRSARAAAIDAVQTVSVWADPTHNLRRPLPHGRDAWRHYTRTR